MSTRLLSRCAVPLLVLVLTSGALAGTPSATAQPAGSPAAAIPQGDQRAALLSGWRPRPEQYPRTVIDTDLTIPMSDGVVLRGDLVRPADAAGNPIPGRFPVVVTITAYNKTALSSAGGLGGPGPEYLVKRGYAQLTVDARGTGSSGGTWGAFSARESKDAGEIVEWAHRQRAWSNGDIAMTGPSYMGISQILAASHQPAGLKAIFPQVPAADVYRDVVASGGQLDVGFIPLWLGLVTATGLIPPAYAASDPASGVGTLLDHVTAFGTFTLPLLLGATLGADAAYDGPFYAERSPINVVGDVSVPTFLIGGHYDLFQRGTPLLFENLRTRGVPTKMILGPWDHLQGSSGDGVAAAGYGTLEELQLRWFDHHVRGIADPALDSDIAPLTYHEIGTGQWRQARDWIGPNLRATSFKLSGSATPTLAAGGLTTGAAAPGTSSVPPVPVSGLCTRSANQWTAGLPASIVADLPCFADNRWNDLSGLVFETEPMRAPVRLQGPINARLFTSTVGGDGMLSVSVSDVAPDGTVNRLTGGWQVISHRRLDTGRSRYLDGKLIQPHHPFTKAAKQSLDGNQVAPVDVEIFPTGAQIPRGHRLRVAIQAFDIPHLLPHLGDILSPLTMMTIHSSAAYPSELTVPTVHRFASRTTARLARKRTRVGQRNRVRVRVTHRGFGVATGRVRVRVAGAPARTVALDRRGRVSVRLPKAGRSGRQRVVVRYLGDAERLPSRDRAIWRVRR